jgi:glycosyltransferase involved in cell wall biosynthesis
VHTFHLSNGVDPARFGPHLRTKKARDELGGPGGTVVLYAGLHGLAQGLEQVLAAAVLLRDVPELRFVLVGDGPEKRALQAQARQERLTNVVFLDPRPAAQVPALLAASNLVLVPLKKHILGAVPSKLYEAMASARPVVMMAAGEAAAIVQETQAGLVVQPGDVAGLAAALRRLAGDPQTAAEFGANGRRAALNQYNRDLIAARFLHYLAEQGGRR